MNNKTFVDVGGGLMISPWEHRWWKLGGICLTMSTTIFLVVICDTAICSTAKLAKTAYFYIISLSGILLINILCNWPVNALISILPSATLNRMHEHCRAFLFMENFCCQVILFHLIGSSSDAYARIVFPVYYIRSSLHPLATAIKLSAPWVVGSFQALTQTFFFNSTGTVYFEKGLICLSRDPNFSILRTALGLVFPLFTGMILLLITACKLRAALDELFLIRSRTPEHERQPISESAHNYTAMSKSAFHCKHSPAKSGQLKCNVSLTPQRRKRNNSVVEAERTLLFDCPKHGQILFLTTVGQSKSETNSSIKKSSAPSLVWHRSEVEPSQANSKQVSPSKKAPELRNVTSSDPNVADSIPVVSKERIQSHFSPESPFAQQREACRCQSDCHLQRAEEEPGHASVVPMSHQTEDSTALREADLDEQRRIALNNMVICFVSISAWSPFMLATFLKVMCNLNECSFSITSITLLKFKWLTYLSSVFYLLGFILVDRKLRTHVNVCFEQRLRMWQQRSPF